MVPTRVRNTDVQPLDEHTSRTTRTSMLAHGGAD